MDEPRIALDLEGVLADTHLPVLEYSYLETEHFDTWSFEEENYEEFMDTLRWVWNERWQEIPACSDDLSEQVDDLRRIAQVDLVTNTPGPRERVLDWLDLHDIEVDNVYLPGPDTNKEELDYHVYIDDNPGLVGKVPLLYFMTTQWNDDITSDNIDDQNDPAKIVYYDMTEDEPMIINSIHDDRSTVVRVDTLEQVYVDLTHRQVDTAVAI